MSQKIGLVTCFINNYGACLQAYALNKTISSFGYNCEIIRYVEPKSYEKKAFFQRIKKNSLTKSLYALISKSYRNQLENMKHFDEFRKSFLSFSSKEYAKGEQLFNVESEYDAFVCGSDQIWNPIFCGEYFFAYMLGFVRSKPKIAYAPSIGIDYIPDNYIEIMKNYVMDFSFVSCREETGTELIKKHFKKDAVTVLDPTLLLNGDEWRIVELKVKMNCEIPYVLCYLFDDRDFYIDFIEDIKSKFQLEIIIIPLTKKQEQWNYTKVKSFGPSEFVFLIDKAELVITDSFHATAFSINMNTPFYSLIRNLKNEKIDMRSRIQNILDILELNSRMIIDDEYKGIDSYKMDFSKVNEKLIFRRNNDKEILKSELGKAIANNHKRSNI